MKKNRFDERSVMELFGDLISERSSQGEQVSFEVFYQGVNKPKIWFRFGIVNPNKTNFSPYEEVTDWLPPHFNWSRSDDRPDTIQSDQFTSWRDLIESPIGISQELQGIANAGGRNFRYTVLNEDPSLEKVANE